MYEDTESDHRVIGAAEVVGDDVEELALLAARRLQFQKPPRGIGSPYRNALCLQEIRIPSGPRPDLKDLAALAGAVATWRSAASRLGEGNGSTMRLYSSAQPS
jgi:hypothetical protein